jgi:hypothetical protein
MSDYIRMRQVFIGGQILQITDDYYRILQNQMFSQIWREREHRCVISKIPLIGGRTYMFHHILAKQSFEKYALCKWNIMILHYDVHNMYETNPDTVPQIHEYRAQLLHQLDYLNYEYDNDHIWAPGSEPIDHINAFLGNRFKEAPRPGSGKRVDRGRFI